MGKKRISEGFKVFLQRTAPQDGVILQLMTVTTRGPRALADASMVVESEEFAIKRMMERFEALYATNPELILTDATWINVRY